MAVAVKFLVLLAKRKMVSVVAMLPLWDFSQGFASYEKIFLHLYYAAYGAKGALGYPIKL